MILQTCRNNVENIIETKNSANLLEVNIDENLTFDNQILCLCNKVFLQLNAINRLTI